MEPFEQRGLLNLEKETEVVHLMHEKKKKRAPPKTFVVREESFFLVRAPLPLGKSLLSLEKSEETSLLATEDRDAPPLDRYEFSA